MSADLKVPEYDTQFSRIFCRALLLLAAC